ncbi:hypothetical protein [Mariniblastus fucicola]|uniref:Bifunctional uridylyltransferase/uridylyl-removing enzyme n=1 Tax=Mariniblastus fucicola TaxID=980251 RepID=A0A5B9PAC4_9BACT|nr:hypothetical protein [Mariniblastus fucicola]QEG23328.1 Bifunctional uridylyltransferase/uridylyl-removing enzyme [Mariniblastus fucicola]
MENQFKLPDENLGNGESSRRVSDLIEEIRADIDFELDDAVTDIVRDLPEEYFQRMDHENQVTHLKGLIASRICQLSSELFLPSTDGTQVAVLGRKSYRGQLAYILSELPGKRTRLVGANIYTARSHGFILDVFEFETDQNPAVDASFSAEIVEKLAEKTASPTDSVADFLSRIRTTSAKSPNLEKLARFYSAYQQVSPQKPIVVDQGESVDSLSDIVLAIQSQDERLTFQRTTESLSKLSLDIEQAELVVVRFDKAADEPVSQRSNKVVLMNFLVSESEVGPFEVEAWIDSLTSVVSG